MIPPNGSIHLEEGKKKGRGIISEDQPVEIKAGKQNFFYLIIYFFL